jgi:hypothetical protein
MEEGSFEELPSSVQARGMLHNTPFFKSECRDIMLRFAEAIQRFPKKRKKHCQFKERKTGPHQNL